MGLSKTTWSDSQIRLMAMQAGLRAGELDDQIIILEPTETQDSDFGSISEAWSTLDTIWADYNPIGGQEFFRSQQVTARRVGTFTIRHHDSILVTHRISFDGDTWDINRIDKVGRQEKMILFATARDD